MVGKKPVMTRLKSKAKRFKFNLNNKGIIKDFWTIRREMSIIRPF